VFSFFQKWRRAKEQHAGLSESQLESMRMMQAAKDEIMPRVREVLDLWRVNRLECSCVMSEEHFAERLIAIKENSFISFEELAKIEAKGLMSVWMEEAAVRKQEFHQSLDAEAREFIEILEIGEEIEKLLDREIAQATMQLLESIDATIDEAIERRGEVRSAIETDGKTGSAGP
jgi:hypothetical protein